MVTPELRELSVGEGTLTKRDDVRINIDAEKVLGIDVLQEKTEHPAPAAAKVHDPSVGVYTVGPSFPRIGLHNLVEVESLEQRVTAGRAPTASLGVASAGNAERVMPRWNGVVMLSARIPNHAWSDSPANASVGLVPSVGRSELGAALVVCERLTRDKISRNHATNR